MKPIACLLLAPLIAATLLTAGCGDPQARKDLADLRAELRDHRFAFSNPKLEVSILKNEVLPASGEYDYPKVRVTGIVRQTAEYPMDHYNVLLKLKVKYTQGEDTALQALVLVKDKTGAFTVDETLYGRKKETPTLKAVALVEANWWQPRDWQEFITFKPVEPEN